MGWRQIGNHSYYYRTRRRGGRVVSEYLGRVEAAGLIAQLEALDRQEREAERERSRAEREQAEREDAEIRAWFDRVQAVADAALYAAGYHKRKGQWRRRRHGGDGRRDGGQ